MANIKSIIASHLAQRDIQRQRSAFERRLLAQDRTLYNIVSVDGNIAVPGKKGFVWCQEYSPSDDTSPVHVFNAKVQPRAGLPVWVGPGLGGRLEILDWHKGSIIDLDEYAGQAYQKDHHTDHEWPDFKPGPDVVNVYPRALTMLRTYPGEGGSLTVSVAPLRYVKDRTITLFPGKNSLDISSSQPASGLALFVGIYLDFDDNTIKTVDGSTTGDSTSQIPDSPTFPDSAIISALVRLDGDQTAISEVDIVDARQVVDFSAAAMDDAKHKLISPDGNTDPVLSADNNGDLAGVGRLSLGGASAGGQILDAEGDDTNLIIRLANTKASSVNNSAELTLAALTSTGSRTVFNIDASFDNVTDASRNSLVVLRTAASGTFGDTVTIDGNDVTFDADVFAGDSERGIVEAPAWFDFTLVDSTEGDHFRQNTAALPTGWSSGTDPDVRFGTHLLYSFYRADTSQSSSGWDMSKQTGIDLENLASNFWMSWEFGFVMFRDGGFTQDVDYYFAVHADDSGSPGTLDADIYARVHLQWDSANSVWQVRGEEKDGSASHNGSWTVIDDPVHQPLFFRIVVRNTATKETRVYWGTSHLPSTHTTLQSQNPTSAPTWGTVHLKMHLTRGTGVQDRLLVGFIDYLGDES